MTAMYDIDAVLQKVRNYILANRKRGHSTNLIIRDNGKASRLGVRRLERMASGETEVSAEIIEWR